MQDLLTSALALDPLRLLDINMYIIRSLIFHLGLRLPIVIFASELNTSTRPTERLIDICKGVGANRLIIGGGKSQSVHDLGSLKSNRIEVLLQDYSSGHPSYPQTRHRLLGFAAGLSTIDALFNTGAEHTRSLVSAQQYTPTPLNMN